MLFGGGGVQSGIEIGKLLTAKKKRDAKLKREQKKAENEAKKQVSSGEKPQATRGRPSEVTSGLVTLWQNKAARRPPGGLSKPPAEQGGVVASPDGRVNWASRQDADPATHSLVLDVSTASFVDTVAVKTLTNVLVLKVLDRQMLKWGDRHEVGLVLSLSCSYRYSETLEKLMWTSTWPAAKVSAAPLPKREQNALDVYTHTHIHVCVYVCVYVYIYMCICVEAVGRINAHYS